MKYFLILVNRVLIENNPPIVQEWIRGDLVKGVRRWHKGEKDEAMIEGEMTQVTLWDYDSLMYRHVRIAEPTEQFAKRLYDHKIGSTDRRPVTKSPG